MVRSEVRREPSDPMIGERVRAEVRAWLAENWRPGLPLWQWLELALPTGWLAPSWPTEWFGRALLPDLGPIIEEEFTHHFVVLDNAGSVASVRSGGTLGSEFDEF